MGILKEVYDTLVEQAQYKKGYRQAMEGQQKSFINSEWKHRDPKMKAIYNKGYEDGMRERQTKFFDKK